jgi:hypothetical protein
MQGGDDFVQRSIATSNFDYSYRDQEIDTVNVDTFVLAVNRTTNKLPVDDTAVNASVTWNATYPPGQYLADSGRRYCQNLWFSLIGLVDVPAWRSNNDTPDFTVQGKDSTVNCALGEHETMAIIVAPTAINGGDVTDILCNNPDAIAASSETPFFNRSTTNPALCFETIKGFNGQIRFKTLSDYTWVVTQKMTYADTSLRVIPLNTGRLIAGNTTMSIAATEKITAGNTVVFVAGSRQDRIASGGSYSMTDVKGNTWESLIQGTQTNGLTDVMIFKSSLTSDLQVGDDLLVTCSQTLGQNYFYSGLYVINSPSVSVVDLDDFWGTTATRSPRITGGKLVVNVFATGGSGTSIDISNPRDWTPVGIMDSRQSGNSAWSCYARDLPDSLFASDITMTTSANYSGVAASFTW